MTKSTKIKEATLEYFGLGYVKSDEPRAGWFVYTLQPGGRNNYPGSSCECLEDAIGWYKSAVLLDKKIKQ